MFWVYKAEGIETNFLRGIGLRETKQVAVLGRGVLVEMKPIFCDCKTNPRVGGLRAEGNVSQITCFRVMGLKEKKLICVGL